MSTASESIASRPRAAPPRLNLLPAPPPTPERSRWVRLPWLAGILLLVVTILGAGQILQKSPGDVSRDASIVAGGSTAAGSATAVVCHGSVDVEGQLVQLAPTQMGEVMELLVREGQTVKEGDAILKVNEEPAKLAIAQFELGVQHAETLLAQAKRGTEALRLGLEKQQKGIDAAEAKLAIAESQLRRLEGLKKDNLTNENDLNAARQSVKALKAALAAEQIEYRRIQATNPEDKIREAEVGVKLANERLRAEKYKLEQCTLRAKDEGTILRLNVAKGMLITNQMRQPPVLFCPSGPRIVRAELLTEFAHRVQPGMDAIIHDEANLGFSWQGKVKRLADGYLPKRSLGTEVFSLGTNDALLLECIVELAPTANPPRIGQRVRIALGAHPAP